MVAKPAKKRSHGKNLNLYEKFQRNGSRPLPLEFDYSSNQFRAVGENYQLFVRLVSNEVDKHAPFHYRSWQEVPGEIKMSILTTLHHYFDLQRYHNTEYWEGIKQGIQSDCANRYKDRKTKLKKHFDKVGGYDNTERAKTKPPEGMNPVAWVRVIEELFTTPTYQKRSQANSANRSKQLYGSYHGTQSYAQRRYTEVQETGVPKHVEGWREMHCKGSSGWYNEMAETHWITNLLKNSINNQTQTQKQSLSDSLKISLKLNSQNYALWSRMIRVAIGGRSKPLLNHLTTEPDKDQHEQWEQDDLVVFSWLIQNIEPDLASNLTEFPTTKALWDVLVVTYSSGKDKLQTFDLHVKANSMKQNGSPFENFWIAMQGVWGEIERRDPNPMTCAVDIATYNKLRSEQKLFQFLNALDRQYDPIKREILRWDPLPSVEGAYAAVRKEMAHQGILGTTENVTSSGGVAAGLSTNGSKEPESLGFLSKGRPNQKNSSSSSRIDKTKLKCDHCGMTRHTKNQCFQLVGYPEWWTDGHKKGNKEGGKAAATIGRTEEDEMRGTAFGGFTFGPSTAHEITENEEIAQNCGDLNNAWIFDCGATDTMTFDVSDIVSQSKPRVDYIKTANGGSAPVKGGGTIEISPTLKLSNCLYVPSLSHKISGREQSLGVALNVVDYTMWRK
ncbi:hypothetical protein E3N88_24425 [Mikania micrantha]|uniref:Retrovirus-related Pol polyprotein from transposon TNT 1-94-like beta-barrel domain-containing protein n=1 Tax=Mikania micrantha TaxID=192012 RepID=A0A5N6N2E7_9ASTR|nr:hypothetical protein E3N88_24425 [Mikania micrantha]